MKDINELVLCKADYATDEEFRNAIRDAVVLLLNANYIMIVRYDEPSLGVAVIEYENPNVEYGCHYPYWLSSDEYNSIMWDEEKYNSEK